MHTQLRKENMQMTGSNLRYLNGVLTDVSAEDSWESLGEQGDQTSQPWTFIGMTDAEVEPPIFCLPDVKSWFTGKDPDAGKDWGQEEKEATEDEMVGWHHWLNGLEFEQTSGDSKEQGSLACCHPWGPKQLDSTEWLNNNKRYTHGSY